MPASWAHSLAPLALRTLNVFQKRTVYKWSSFYWRGHFFPNPLGIAGGVDKDAHALECWQNLGAGFLEVGTVTREPQKILPPPYIKRDYKTKSLWNRMGFPSQGVEKIRKNLEKMSLNVPLWVNIGKNRQTPLERAHEDYIFCAQRLAPFAQGFVINISSPNTEGLRDLLEPSRLGQFLNLVLPELKASDKLVLLKLSPDMSLAQLEETLDASLSVDGWILTNTKAVWGR